jgi:hypothetical protein
MWPGGEAKEVRGKGIAPDKHHRQAGEMAAENQAGLKLENCL